MKLKIRLVLLSLRMVLTGITAEFVNKLLLCLAFSKADVPYSITFLLDKILCRARLSFTNAEKAFNILLYYHTGRALLTEQQ